MKLQRINQRLARGVSLVDTRYLEVVLWMRHRGMRFRAETWRIEHGRVFTVSLASPKHHRWWAAHFYIRVGRSQ